MPESFMHKMPNWMLGTLVITFSILIMGIAFIAFSYGSIILQSNKVSVEVSNVKITTEKIKQLQNSYEQLKQKNELLKSKTQKSIQEIEQFLNSNSVMFLNNFNSTNKTFPLINDLQNMKNSLSDQKAIINQQDKDIESLGASLKQVIEGNILNSH